MATPAGLPCVAARGASATRGPARQTRASEGGALVQAEVAAASLRVSLFGLRPQSPWRAEQDRPRDARRASAVAQHLCRVLGLRLCLRAGDLTLRQVSGDLTPSRRIQRLRKMATSMTG